LHKYLYPAEQHSAYNDRSALTSERTE